MIPSSLMGSLFPLIVATFVLFSNSLVLGQIVPASTISAAPSVLPDSSSSPPLSSPPALSPDITPLFPSPGGSDLSPSESSLPLIPSSPSPPNPDALVAPGPGAAVSPSEPLPDSSAVGLSVKVLLEALVVVVVFGGVFG